MWRVICRVSGGVTGTRMTELKRLGKLARFDTREDAQLEADRLIKSMNHEHSVAYFEYWPGQVIDDCPDHRGPCDPGAYGYCRYCGRMVMTASERDEAIARAQGARWEV